MTLQDIFQLFYAPGFVFYAGFVSVEMWRQSPPSLCPPAEDIVSTRQNISNSHQISHVLWNYGGWSGVTVAGGTKQKIINVCKDISLKLGCFGGYN